MNERNSAVIIASLAFATSTVAAQHQGHQMPGMTEGSAATPCARVQPLVQNVIAAATSRLESARQTNSPAEMRAAIDDLQSALRDIKTQLAPCATTAGAGAEHEMSDGKASAAPQPHHSAQEDHSADGHSGEGQQNRGR